MDLRAIIHPFHNEIGRKIVRTFFTRKCEPVFSPKRLALAISVIYCKARFFKAMFKKSFKAARNYFCAYAAPRKACVNRKKADKRCAAARVVFNQNKAERAEPGTVLKRPLFAVTASKSLARDSIASFFSLYRQKYDILKLRSTLKALVSQKSGVSSTRQYFRIARRKTPEDGENKAFRATGFDSLSLNRIKLFLIKEANKILVAVAFARRQSFYVVNYAFFCYKRRVIFIIKRVAL